MAEPGIHEIVAQGRLLTLVFTDLVDSVGLKTRLGDSEAGHLIAGHQAGIRKLTAATGGREILIAGDGCFLTFEVPSKAVEFALRLQDFHRQQPALPQVRVGVHMGEVTETVHESSAGRTIEVNGLAVDIASRIQSMARPRQILMSYAVFDNARQRLDASNLQLPVEWLAHGRYILRGADMALEIFEAGLKGLSDFTPPTGGSNAQRDVHGEQESTLGWRPAQGHDLPGRPNWVLIEKLGEGGFGDVWLTEHRKTRDRHVIKFCYSVDRLRTLKREVTLFRLLKETLGDRPDIARVLDYQFEHKPYFLEMEFAGRHNLTSWLEEHGGAEAIPLDTRIELVAQVAVAIAAAHSVGVLHKDIKPSNIMVASGTPTHPRICMIDFGIGAVSDRNLLDIQGITATGLTEVESSGDYASSLAGTRLYMAPELIEGKNATTKSDIYSLGVLLYQMVSAKLNHSLAFGWERDVVDEILRRDIEDCVDGQPEKRLESAEILAHRLRSLPERRAELARTRQDARHVEEIKKRWRLIYLGAALLFVMLVMIGQFALLQYQKARSEENLRKKADAATVQAMEQSAETEVALAKAQQARYFGAIALAESSLRESRLEKAQNILLNEAPRDLLQREWGWLLAQSSPEDVAIKNANINDAVFTPDGSRFVTGNRDTDAKGHVTVYNAGTAQRLSDTLTNNRLVWNLAISPDGLTAATASSDNKISVVDLTSQTIIRELTAHSGIVRDVAFSPDGKLLASVSRDHTLRVWNTKNYSNDHVFTVQTDNFTELDFSRDSRYLVTGSLEGHARIFDTSGTRQICELAGGDGRILSVAFLENGEGVATACTDGAARIYPWPPPADATTLDPTTVIRTRETYPSQVISSIDGKAVYIGNDNGLIMKSDAVTGKLLFSCRVDEPLWKMSLNHDGKKLLTTARWSLRLLDLERLEGSFEITDWPIATSAPLNSMPMKIASVSRLRDHTWDDDKAWRTTSGLSLVSTKHGDHFMVQSASDIYSPDGIWHIKIDPENSKATIQSRNGDRAVHILSNKKVVDVIFSPDGKQAAGLFDKEGVAVYNTSTWERLYQLPTSVNHPVYVKYSPDSKMLIVCYYNGLVSAYDVTGTHLRDLLPADNGSPMTLDFSKDGRLLAAGLNVDRAIVIDLETGDHISTMTGHVRYIYGVEFTSDDERLITLSRDGTVKMWDVKSGRELVTLFKLQDGELPLGMVIGSNSRQFSIATSERRVVSTEVFPWNLAVYPDPIGNYTLAERVELWNRRVRLNPNLRMKDTKANQ